MPTINSSSIISRCAYLSTKARIAVWLRRNGKEFAQRRRADQSSKQKIIYRSLEGKCKFMTISELYGSVDPLFVPSGANFISLYTYETLPGLKHVRLLKVDHGATSDSLVFEFVTAPLDEVRNQFVAISYCWGKAKRDRFLVLRGGVVVPITANVESLIAQIFAGHDRELIWIDAVCINQDDIAERSAQVQIMKDIYDAARRVSVWLGAPEGDLFEAAKTQRLWINGWHKISGKEDYDDEGSDLETFTKTTMLFGELVELPWFSSVWVI